MFKVGDEVVALPDEAPNSNDETVTGSVYTVSEVRSRRGGYAIWFAEFGAWSSYHQGYNPAFFRKVQKRTTEVGMAILHRIRKEAGERVH